jgi:hypothetical protein
MKSSFRIWRVLAIVAVLIGVAAVAAWRQGIFQPFGLYRPANSLMVILPYQYGGVWVSDQCSH